MRVFTSIPELVAATGEHLGYSEWRTIDQERIKLFADATDDHQWIHLDTEKAAKGPFGTTIAHGFLTLSLLPALSGEIYKVEGVRMGVNYGLNRVRFPAPVPSGSRVRAGGKIVSAEEVAGGVQIVFEVTVEREGGDKPVCVAETVSRFYV